MTDSISKMASLEASNQNVLARALEFYLEGIVPLPVNRHRQKAPAVSSWTQYQKEMPTKEQILEWFSKADGLGVLCGQISGNLFMIEIEGRAATLQTIDLLTHRAKENNILDLFERLNAGYVERSPSGGLHWLLKSDCLLYTSPSPRDGLLSRMPSSA